jgi:hypothetical protein
MHPFSLRFLLLTIVWVGAATLSAAPFQNGNFEMRSVTEPDLLPLGDKSVTAWQVGGTESNVHWGFYGPGNHVIRFDPITAGATQWIEQTFDTEPGLEYRVAFKGNIYNTDNLAGVRVESLDETGTNVSREFVFGGDLGIVWAHGGVFHFTARAATSTLRFTQVTQGSPRATTEIDDVSVQPRAPKTEITAFPAIKINGFMHTGYRVEYAETRAPLVWKKLTDVWVNDVAPIVIDTNAPSTGARIYRVLELPPE